MVERPSMQIERQLRDYLNLQVDLPALYEAWTKADSRFGQISALYPGIRMLRQDPWENLLCFICSTNNNISRITQMVHGLCRHYGTLSGSVDGTDYFSFPEVDALQHDTLERELRDLGFGYRAKFLAHTARAIAALPRDHLLSLRTLPYEEAHIALTQFMGVGAKVADCVALMSLDKSDAVPVDTHVFQIAHRDYKIRSKRPEDIKAFFRQLWGEYAGWAHSILFTADLSLFKKELLETKVSETLSIKVDPEPLIKAETTSPVHRIADAPDATIVSKRRKRSRMLKSETV